MATRSRNEPPSPADKEQPLTRLAGKHWSPLIIRKYTRWGPPIYVAIITDDNLDDLDRKVSEFLEGALPKDEDDKWTWPPSIQDQRDLAGGMTDFLVHHYNKCEGVAVILYADKMFTSSLHGDFMIHTSCRIELYGLLQMSTGV